jgi:hypothetical protein
MFLVALSWLQPYGLLLSRIRGGVFTNIAQ